MKFTYNGIEWDTDKKVFVAGFSILDTDWFFLDRREGYPGKNSATIREYGVQFKKGQIEEIIVDFNDGKSYVSDFAVHVPLKGTQRASVLFIGKSVSEVKRILDI